LPLVTDALGRYDDRVNYREFKIDRLQKGKAFLFSSQIFSSPGRPKPSGLSRNALHGDRPNRRKSRSMFEFSGRVCISIRSSGKRLKNIVITSGKRTNIVAFTRAVRRKTWKWAQASDSDRKFKFV